ncbi:nucleotidyltransferase [Ectopseudomonas composti]|jgi:predicted nucleotidyltransferase|uniref:tRNA nucleotidyltransferase n=1 Tax=Ectopseudomonas mendocina TaxID=300 RepID=A0A379IUV2_ECTME|nr:MULTISPECIES: CBASS oligonucleotide cyclase [Pseudomonas]MAK68383.1 nucleotidyltransferase [Halieaceae bacterium]MBJ7546255.1 nucleotidyltransferase [Pseudomonas sp. OA3]SUD40087.1 tRNA nucleotidyltransferase [Pseudomonas mendocina]|tara:strand:- start:9161 stop:10126 length:966 start_codon:yes stop_codon:yes gene_type:complete
MAREHIDHKDIARFAEEKVNLPKEKAQQYREQAQRLQDKLEGYLADHDDFSLKRMMLSGSLAKGTALRSLNDIDVAVYISGSEAPHDIRDLLDYLAEKLRKAFPNFMPDQVKPQTYSVTVSFKGSGLDVDVVPVLYSGLPNWRGNLVSQEDGSFLETSIPLHLEFAKARKRAAPTHFAQVVRLAKYWARLMKQERQDFRFKSFMIELIMAKLCDDGVDFSDYPEALQAFFTYLATSGLRQRIVFEDNYAASKVGALSDLVQIIDPVNPSNNVARLYTQRNVDAIVDAAMEAGDAIEAATYAPTKQLTVGYWQKVFGSSFQG